MTKRNVSKTLRDHQLSWENVALSIQETRQGILFKAIIQPRSSKNMICGIKAGALKIKLTAPPVNGAANKLCVKFLASVLKIPVSDIEIVSGQHGRNKKILVHLMTRKNLESKLFPPKADEPQHIPFE